MPTENPSSSLDGIAVVGLAGRFPGARNCDEFWQNLRAGREGLTFFSDEELTDAGYIGPHSGKRVRSRGVVDNADLFDAAFFGYSPREAEIMDPQQRVFLEVAWTALENAGFDPDRVPGAVGVFAGASINTYYPTNVVSRPDVLGPFGVFPAVTLNEKDFLATRVAYKLNLRGPAISVQTACSTSLVAVCNACQSLLSYECDIALAGGVAINFPQCHSHIHEDGGMISADGRCRPFDKSATGTLFSDGAGAVTLRRLEDAVKDGDNILAVIKGFALNNDGSDKPGFTAPSVNGQAEVIQMAQVFGDIDPATISYIEAHGTATPLGDPIEIAALTQAFRAGTDASQYCAIGSVKSNIGHLDVAAGVAGLIKTVLALKHGEIPPTLHYSEPNPNIDFESTPFIPVDKLLKWQPQGGIPRRAGVSSFGIGGTNAHVVLEETPKTNASGPSRSCQLLPVSARSKTAVNSATENLAGYLQSHADVPLADIAFTLQTGRHQFNQRRFVVCQDHATATAELSADCLEDHPILAPARHNPPVIFMFPGQGAQRVNMGRELYDNEPVYRDIVDQCTEALKPELGLDMRDVLFPPEDKLAWAEKQLVQTSITQPALFVTEYALARLWMAWGIRPHAMIGHSVGEYTAACLSGVFSLEDGLKLIAARGRLIQEQPAGRMLAVMTGEADVQSLLIDGVTIATINAASLCVVSGNHEDIVRMEAVLVENQLEFRPLQTSHAFHSAMMEPVVAPFTELLGDVQLADPKIPFVSNLTAEWISAEEATNPSYWAQHLRQAVRFADGIEVLLADSDNYVLLEVGPGGTLTSLTRQHTSKKPSHVVVPSLPYGPAMQTETSGLLNTMGRMWQAGVNIDWAAFYDRESRRRVALPCYPFEHKKFFIEPGHLTYAASPPPVEQVVTPPALAAEQAEIVIESGNDANSAIDRLYACLETLSGLSKDEIGKNKTFLELGFDSLFLSQVCSAVAAEFGISVTIRQIADSLSSVAELAAYLESSLAGDIVTRIHADTNSEVAAVQNADLKLPLTDAQREIWFASQVDDDASRTYNEAYVVDIEGQLQVDHLAASLQLIVDRHDALRTTISSDGSEQTMSARMHANLEKISLGENGNEAEVARKLAEMINSSTTELFDFAVGPLFRFKLIKYGEQRWNLLLIIHHIVADGWSWGVLLQELGDIYSALSTGNTPPDRPALQYADYASWLASTEQKKQTATAVSYWIDLLGDKPEELELPSDRPRPALKTYRSGRVRHRFDADLITRLKAVAREQNATPFHLITATYHAWLQRITGRTDLVVAIPTAGQVTSGLQHIRHAQNLVGHCVNMLPVRANYTDGDLFRDFLRQMKSRLLDARDNQDVSFGNLINELKWHRDASRVPIASVSLNLGRAHQLQLHGVNAKTRSPAKAFNFFDITADVLEDANGFVVDCKFNADMFDIETVERWLEQWERLMHETLSNLDVPLRDQLLLTDDERQKLLHDWNATETDFPRQNCIHDLVEAQTIRSPSRIAVKSGTTALSYAQLEAQANRFAQALRARGIGRGDHVGVCLERSTEMLAVALGTLKAGAAYVPLDPSFPEERLNFMAEDAQLALLVSTSALVNCFKRPREQLLLLDEDADGLAAQSESLVTADAERDAQPEDPAYLIYTSGTTGKPKGVVVPHRSVVNFLSSMAHKPGLSEKDVLLAVTTLSFDIAVLELYLPLMRGATVVIASRGETVDGEAIKALIELHQVNVMQATPITWRLLLEAGWQGTPGFKALVGGEALPKDLADKLISHDIELWNMYGPTETTVWSTCCRVTDTANGITIGTPIDNTTIYILDAHKNICPIGVPGELYIGGDGVTHGYWQRPELTAERFIPDPYGKNKGANMYGTGDKARWLNNGTIQHLGRLDDQVKIRGFRVELGEIEARISEQDGIRSAAVRLWKLSEDDVRIVACCVPEQAGRLPTVSLRKNLRATLPDYMIPQYFLLVDAIPLTPNGKIDRKQLPIPELLQSNVGDYEAPINKVESTIAKIWTDLLQPARPIGRRDKFFEMGGHSLLALRAQRIMEDELGAHLELRVLFQDNLTDIARRFDIEHDLQRVDSVASP